MSEVEQIEAKRAKRKADKEAARETQYVEDLKAVDAYEEANDCELDLAVRIPLETWRPGMPTLVGVKAPAASEYKRFQQLTRDAKENEKKKHEAIEQIGRVAWAYPADEDAKKLLLEEMPALLIFVGSRAVKLREARIKEEGKG